MRLLPLLLSSSVCGDAGGFVFQHCVRSVPLIEVLQQRPGNYDVPYFCPPPQKKTI